MTPRKKALWIPAKGSGKNNSDSLFQIFLSCAQLENVPCSCWLGRASINLETAVGSQKSTQALGALSKIKKVSSPIR
jgi:hypothetical protein